MPRRQEHMQAATAIGIAIGVVTAPPAMVGNQAAAYMLGCILSARFGGQLPDLLEPACHPRHRAFFHSQTAVAGTTKVGVAAPLSFVAWRSERIDRAGALKLQREALGPDDPRSTALWLDEMVESFLAGCSAGLFLGYMTHLIQDSGTSPLPLI